MISDIVCEYLVKRKLSPTELGQAAGVAGLGLLLTWFFRSVGVLIDRTGMMSLLLFLVGAGLTVFFVRMALMVEYEYTIVNGEMTVDRIRAQSSRKSLLDLNVKHIEKMGKYDPAAVATLGKVKVLDYSADKANPDTYYAFYKDEKTNINTVLLFTANQKMLDALKASVSATVYREAFRK